MRAVLIWSDIGHYHAARSRALQKYSSNQVETLEIRGVAAFEQFRAGENDFDFKYHALGINGALTRKNVAIPLEKKLDVLRPDVVFVPGWSTVEALVALHWCASHGVASVIMSDSKQESRNRVIAKEFIKRRIVHGAGAALVAGSNQAAYVQELGMPRERIFVGYDAVDNDRFSSAAIEVRSDSSHFRSVHNLPERYFLCCARLVEEKNLLRLVDAYKIYFYRASVGAWPLLIVGPGSMEDELRVKLNDSGLGPYVQLRGAQPYDALPVYYSLAEALILPSISETWGLVVNEAMASGLPVLVSKQCGCVDDLVVEGVNGFVFDGFDVGAIAAVLSKISSPNCNRVAMGDAGVKMISKWGLERFVSGFDGAAMAALSTSGRTGSVFDRLILFGLACRWSH